MRNPAGNFHVEIEDGCSNRPKGPRSLGLEIPRLELSVCSKWYTNGPGVLAFREGGFGRHSRDGGGACAV